MGNDCSSLSDDANPCKISACVNSITSLAANSVSPTETFVVTMKRNTHYRNHPVKRAFMKIWQTGHTAQEEGLRFEMAVYRDVIKPLIDDGTCPFFVRFIAGSESCSYRQLIRLAELNFVRPTDERRLKKYNLAVEKRVLRNLFFVARNIRFRPSLSEPIPFKPDKAKDKAREFARSAISDPEFFDRQRNEFKNAKFSFLITELVTPFKTLANLADFRPKTEDVVAALFQLTYAIFIMASVKMNHGDLHMGNVLIQEMPQVIEITFADGTNVKFYSRLFVQIYDFDRAYVESLGPNPLLRKFPGILSKNEFIENKDLIYVYKQLYEYYDNAKMRALILSTVSSTPKARQAFIDLGPYFLTSPDSEVFVKAPFFDQFHSTRTAMNKIGHFLPEVKKEPDLILTCAF